jgi:hypothetical protein
MAQTVVQSDNRQHFGRTIGGDGSADSVAPLADLGRCGTPRELGLQHGRILKHRVQQTAAAVRELWPAAVGSEVPSQWRLLAPELVDEMAAIAEAADLPLADIVAINEFQDELYRRAHILCAAAVGATTGRHPLLGCSVGLFPLALRSSCAVIRGSLLMGGSGDDEQTFAYFALAGAVGGRSVMHARHAPGHTPWLSEPCTECATKAILIRATDLCCQWAGSARRNRCTVIPAHSLQ